MPGIISPSPEGCLVGVYGHDGIQWVRIAVDASGQIAISAVSLPLPTGAATESTLAAISAKLPSALADDRLKVDGSGVTQPVSADSLPLPAGASTEMTLKALYDILRLKNLHLWESQYNEVLTGSADSGDLILYGTVVPAKKLCVVTNMYAMITSGSAARLNLNWHSTAGNRVLKRLVSPAVNEGLDMQGMLVMQEGDRVRATANSVGVGTSLTLYAAGYYVKASD